MNTLNFVAGIVGCALIAIAGCGHAQATIDGGRPEVGAASCNTGVVNVVRNSFGTLLTGKGMKEWETLGQYGSVVTCDDNGIVQTISPRGNATVYLVKGAMREVDNALQVLFYDLEGKPVGLYSWVSESLKARGTSLAGATLQLQMVTGAERDAVMDALIRAEPSAKWGEADQFTPQPKPACVKCEKDYETDKEKCDADHRGTECANGELGNNCRLLRNNARWGCVLNANQRLLNCQQTNCG